MTDEEIIKVLALIDDALTVFNAHNQSPLTAKQVSVKSMLMALRAQMMNERRRVRAPAE